MAKLFSLIALIISLLCLQTSAAEAFKAYQTNDCHQCKTVHDDDGYFCNTNNTYGYCCPLGSTLENCTANETANRFCSLDAPSDFYFYSCFNVNKDDRCAPTGESPKEVSFRVTSTTEKELELHNIPYAEKTACVWHFWQRNADNFKIFGGQTISLFVKDFYNMDIWVASGSDLAHAKILFSTRYGTITLPKKEEGGQATTTTSTSSHHRLLSAAATTKNTEDYMKFKIEDVVYVAMQPKAADPVPNSVKLVFLQEEKEHEVIDHHLHVLLVTTEVAIIGGGSLFSLLLLVIACFYRRYQKWSRL